MNASKSHGTVLAHGECDVNWLRSGALLRLLMSNRVTGRGRDSSGVRRWNCKTDFTTQPEPHFAFLGLSLFICKIGAVVLVHAGSSKRIPLNTMPCTCH